MPDWRVVNKFYVGAGRVIEAGFLSDGAVSREGQFVPFV